MHRGGAAFRYGVANLFGSVKDEISCRDCIDAAQRTATALVHQRTDAAIPKSHARSATPKTRTMPGSRPRRLEGPRRETIEPKVESGPCSRT
jgi:hypothetical protein